MKGDFSMNPIKFIFKILASPFVLAFTIIAPLLTFLFYSASVFLITPSGIAVLVSIALFFAGTTTSCIMFLIISFLISPFGLQAIAEWLIGRVTDINYSLRAFLIGSAGHIADHLLLAVYAIRHISPIA